MKEAVNAWKEAGGIAEGILFRSINKAGRVWGKGMTPTVLWEVVREAASRASIEKLAPHDLRRTCARLCPSCRWGTGSDSISAWARLHPDHRAVPRMQAEALAACLATIAESGKPVLAPESRGSSGQWRQRVPKSLHTRLVERARREGVSLNSLVATLLAEGIGRKETESELS